MAEGFLKKGFDNLFDPQYRFNSDKSFSKFIFYMGVDFKYLS